MNNLFKFISLIKAKGGVTYVTWTSGVNVTVAGNKLTKTGGSDGVWDAGAVSSQTLASGDGGFTFVAAEADQVIAAIGLSNGDTDQHVNDIDWAIDIRASGNFDAKTNNTTRYSGTYSDGDVLGVAIESGSVKVKKNDVTVFTFTGSPTYPILVDTAILNSNKFWNDIILTGGGFS